MVPWVRIPPSPFFFPEKGFEADLSADEEEGGAKAAGDDGGAQRRVRRNPTLSV